MDFWDSLGFKTYTPQEYEELLERDRAKARQLEVYYDGIAYKVISSREWTVTLDHEEWSCDCPKFRYFLQRRRDCHHIMAVKLYRGEEE